MAITGIDAAKCAKRNRLAALKGFSAGSVRLLASHVAPQPEETLARGYGRLPADDAEALDMINALRTGATPLEVDGVYRHYAEAANSNFIPDRFLFLGGTTLRNMAQDAAAGVAFMNSHRTGGLSEPTELPFGRTFAGRYEEAEGRQRTVLGFYMDKGVAPNGANGPTTDALSQMIDSGTLFDVSVGLYGGRYLCDVCGEDLLATDEHGNYVCPHAPGSHYGMSKGEIGAQKARQVTEGKASCTLTDARMGEVSGVYDGAVPGAGFLKAVNLARRGSLSPAALADCRLAYQQFARASDFGPWDSLAEAKQQAKQLSEAEESAPDVVPATEEAPAAPSFALQLDAALAAVEDCALRAEQLRALRASEGRSLSAARREQLDRIIAQLLAFQALCKDELPTRQKRLSVQALAIREYASNALLGV